jgi:hypothetical protein
VLGFDTETSFDVEELPRGRLASQKVTASIAAARFHGVALLLALVGFAIFRSSVGTRLDSFTLDEPYHIVAGASYVAQETSG